MNLRVGFHFVDSFRLIPNYNLRRQKEECQDTHYQKMKV